MRTNGLATPEAEALAQKEDDHQRWSDDGGLHPEIHLPEPPTDDPVTVGRTGLPVRPVYRRRPAA